MFEKCAGEASTGKTQTCMQLLMTAQWPVAEGGLDGDALCVSPCFPSLSSGFAHLCHAHLPNVRENCVKAVLVTIDPGRRYICTEGDPPTARLHEIAARRRPGCGCAAMYLLLAEADGS